MSDMLQLVVVAAKKLAADERGKTRRDQKQTERGTQTFLFPDASSALAAAEISTETSTR